MSRLHWATVTSVAPLRVRLDGELTALPLTPMSTISPSALTVGDLVSCEWLNGRIVIVGRAGGIPVPPFVTTKTITYTTSSLANNASETGVMDLGVGFTILKFTSNYAARFRAYQTVAHRSADASRVVGVFPSGDHGLIFEEDGAAAGSYATVAAGGLLGGITACPIAITNRSGSARAVTVTLEVRS